MKQLISDILIENTKGWVMKDFYEKYKVDMEIDENFHKAIFDCIQNKVRNDIPNVILKFKMSKWSYLKRNYGIEIDIKGSNSEVLFREIVKKLFDYYDECYGPLRKKFYPYNSDYQTSSGGFGLSNKSPNFRKKLTSSKLYQEFIKWIGDKELYPGDENLKSFLPRIEQIKGVKPDSESSGEKMVRIFLENNKVNFKQYHKIKGCFSEKNGKCYLLTFDFYIPSKNLAIEYDGGQHFAPVSKFGGQETFDRTVMLDGIKNKFCKDNKIKMLRIPYTKTTEEAHKMMKKILGIK